MNDVGHIPVLLEEVVRVLDPSPGETMADGTSGRGGHATALASRLAPGGAIHLNDLDPENLETASARVRGAGEGVEVVSHHGNFAQLPRTCVEQSVKLDGFLLDLGFASTQMDRGERGFSFTNDGPLDMRYDTSSGPSAAEFVRDVSEEELVSILREYGEEPQAKRIARKLVEYRAQTPIVQTSQLAQVVASAVVGKAAHGRIHPATRAFQALRIAVNDELASLRSVLESVGRSAASVKRGTGQTWLSSGARIAVISFHSLEDRIVKRSFAELEDRGLCERITKKPLVASEEERTDNPRSRSAKLRAIRIR